MSQMLPPQGQPDPAQLEAMLAQLGGGGGGAPPEAPPSDGNWLVTAINAVHEGMVQEGDPKQVSLLGAIINQLTTFQANAAAPKSPGG